MGSPRIIFMGTPHFAAGCLQIMLDNDLHIVAVVTATDKPAGRGQRLQFSAVKELAIQENIPVIQPEKLKSPEFVEELSRFKADLFVVVAFRMLPEVVWSMPPSGTINLHASLLPQYRGAAPINRAIMNGEKETGVTTFFIEKEIDTGHILLQEKILIGENENAGSLHDRMMESGGKLLVKTIEAIASGNVNPIPQNNLINQELKDAPKLFKDDGKINWELSAAKIHNHVRGLSPFPGAWSILQTGDNLIQVKIGAGKPIDRKAEKTGKVETDGKSYLHVHTGKGIYQINELQWPGKRKMLTEELLRGTPWQKDWHFTS